MAVVIAFSAILGIYAFFLGAGVTSVASDVFKSLVDADTALLGFLGVITVLAFTTYRDSARHTQDKIDNLSLEHKGRTESQTATRRKELEDLLNEQRKDSTVSFLFTITSAIFFVVSIFLSLLAMSNVTTQIRLYATYSAITAMALGLLYVFVIIYNLSVSLE